jgi:hypothetical protein
MPLVITSDSHTDHGLSPAIRDYIVARFADRDGFFIETFELPEELGTVPCALIGPATGWSPVHEANVRYVVRGGRKCASRVLDADQLTPSRLVTVIAGPHGDAACVLYTAFGGPKAPREPGDPAIASWDELDASRAFWSEHALAHVTLAL